MCLLPSASATKPCACMVSGRSTQGPRAEPKGRLSPTNTSKAFSAAIAIWSVVRQEMHWIAEKMSVSENQRSADVLRPRALPVIAKQH